MSQANPPMNEMGKEDSQVSWSEFCETRLDCITLLAATVEDGVTRHDTKHPAFCGCIDWHSCVHGVYALLTASRLTGEKRWSEAADSILTPAKLEEEFNSVKQDELIHELPYGYAWFLKLAHEREYWSGKMDLLPLATEIAQQLENWIFSLSAEDVLSHAQSRKYGNLSWAVLNLWAWSQLRQDVELREKLSSFTMNRLLILDKELSPSYDQNTGEFFAASLQRTRAIVNILSWCDIQPWLKTFYGKGLSMEPVREAIYPHTAGLNFSRSWGLWDLFKRTGNETFRDMYVNHIMTHMNLPQYWQDNYQKYSHWVAQFGIYAIALSIDDE